MPPRKPYRGILAEPMPRPGDKDYRGLIMLLERLEALREHYDRPREAVFDPLLLLLDLAHDRVPGFRFRSTKRKGPEPKVLNDFIILCKMCMYIEDGHSIKNAARLTAERRPSLGKPETVRRRFSRLNRGGPELRRVIALSGRIQQKPGRN